MTISDQINRIIDRRHAELPAVRARLERWTAVAGLVDDLKDAVEAWKSDSDSDLRDRLAEVRLGEIGAGVAEVIEALRLLESRYSRKTVNIGVSGSARVGKSTLLQSIADVTDDVIPTGSGLPVTAVRSRIFHSSLHRRATVLRHTYETFRDEVLEPFHKDLDLLPVPATVAEFEQYRYPAEPPASTGNRLTTLRSLLERLELMQRALPTYASLLTGGSAEVPFEQLRSYVAYPTLDEERAGTAQHRYLAVREVRIDHPFRSAQVARLGIADMPGLGEVTIGAERRHLDTLQDEIDLVIAAVRTAEGMAYWRDNDARAMELLSEAKGAVALRDYVFLAINDVPGDRERLDGLRQEVLRKVNRGVPDQHVRVVEVDFKDDEAVQRDLLGPVLEHLAAHLPLMDQAVERTTMAKVGTVLARLRAAASDVDATLSRLRVHGGMDERVTERAEALRKSISVDLFLLLRELREGAEGNQEDADYVAAVEAADAALVSWIGDGFGHGEQGWKDRAFRSMVADGNAAQFAAEELTHIRVEISRRFASLDDFFTKRVVALWDRIATILTDRLGGLLNLAEPTPPDLVLGRLATLLAEADEPCPTLAEAVRGLLDIRLDYRTQLYPRVRRELAALNFEVLNPSSGEIVHQLGAQISPDGAEKLLKSIGQLATEAAFQSKRALISESVLPAQVVFAAADHFDDWFIRSIDSKAEFGRLARCYRDDIWPGEFRMLGESNARVTRVRRAARALNSALQELGETP